MAICSACKREQPEPVDEFCKFCGAKLSSRSADVVEPADADDDTASTDEPVDQHIRQLRADLTQRKARIAELEAELTATRRQLEELRASIAGDQGASGAPTRPPEKISAAGSTKHRDSALEDTAVVPPPEDTFGWLVCVAGPLVGKRFAIGANGLQIGRAKKYGEQGGISIADSHVSNPHAWIGREKDAVIVKDQGSTNGTFINKPDSARITKGTTLKEGDSVIIALKEVGEFVYKK
jgi:hypothetical protein